MNLEKMTKSIQRELRTNPKKALLLTLLVVGAGYFWMPIAKRWVGGNSVTAKATAKAPILRDDARPATEASKKPTKVPPWDLLRDAIAQDQLTASADLTSLTRNPFFTAALEMAAEKPEETAEEVPAVVETNIDARKLFMVKSVIVGPGGGVAVVNGDLVRMGDIVVHETNAGKTEFTVTAIENWGIKLRRAEQDWELLVHRPQLHQRDRIVRSDARSPKVVTPSLD